MTIYKHLAQGAPQQLNGSKMPLWLKHEEQHQGAAHTPPGPVDNTIAGPYLQAAHAAFSHRLPVPIFFEMLPDGRPESIIYTPPGQDNDSKVMAIYTPLIYHRDTFREWTYTDNCSLVLKKYFLMLPDKTFVLRPYYMDHGQMQTYPSTFAPRRDNYDNLSYTSRTAPERRVRQRTAPDPPGIKAESSW